jgi:glycerol kinase
MGDNRFLPQDVATTAAERREGWFVGSIDQGTTSTRFLIFNGAGEPVASHQMGFENKHARSG